MSKDEKDITAADGLKYIISNEEITDDDLVYEENSGEVFPAYEVDLESINNCKSHFKAVKV